MAAKNFKVWFAISIGALGFVLALMLAVAPVTEAAGPICTVPGTYSIIQAALNDAGCTTITLGTQMYSNTNLTIDHSVTLNGNGASSTILDGGGFDRVITVTAGTVVLNNLKIQHGFANSNNYSGGGILILTGTVTLNSTTVYSNTATIGGGIANFDTLVMNNSQVTNGLALVGGGIANVDISFSNMAPIRRTPKTSGPSATLTNSNVNDNLAALAGGGIINDVAALTMNGGTLNNNSAMVGGGLYQGDLSDIITTSPIQIPRLPGRRLPSGNFTFAPKAGVSTSNFSNMNISNNNAADNAYSYIFPFPFHVGGGVFNGLDSSLMLTNVGLYSNSAVGSPINLFCSGNCMIEEGGGIFNEGTLTANSSTLGNNSVTGTGVVSTTFNVAIGGGIANDGAMNLTNVIFSGNQAVANAGGSSNSFVGSLGGGVANGAVAIGLSGSPIRLPKQPIAVTATLDKVTFSNNTASVTANTTVFSFAVGGGFVNLSSSGAPATKKKPFAARAPSQGPASALLTNVTFNANSSTAANNANNSFGGAISADGLGLQLVNVTIAGNSTTTPGNAGGVDGGTISFRNVLLANNTNGNCDFTPTSSGGNISSDDTCNFGGPSDQNSISQAGMLGPLANNGGREQTMALLGGNPAIDGGVNAGCPSTDERGVPRPQIVRCDSGAYEAQVLAPAEVPEGDTLLLLGGGLAGLGTWLRVQWSRRRNKVG